MTPIRIQRSREHKQIIPAIYVGRPGKFGNPFKIIGDMVYGNASHRRKIFSPWIYIELANYYPREKTLQEIVVDLYERWLGGIDSNFLIPPPSMDDIIKLRGHNLSCWCKIGDPCHADILLKIANK